MASSASPETHSTSTGKVNSKSNSSIDNGGTNSVTCLQGPRRQTNEKTKSEEESQFNNKSTTSSTKNASILSTQNTLRPNTGNRGKTVGDLLRQYRPAEKPKEQQLDGIQNSASTNKTQKSIPLSLPANSPARSQSQHTICSNATTVGELLKQVKKQHKFPLCSSDEFLSDFVCQLVANGGSLQVKSLRKSHGNFYDSMIKLSPDKTVRGFVQKYSHVLEGSPDIGTINVLTFSSDLEICKVHGSNAGSCTVDCGSLHICKFQMMSQCSRGKTCFFGHNLRNKYNKSVLISHFMDKLSNQQIRAFLCKLNNRRGLTLPGVCTYYNSQKGCRKPNKCPFLHICKRYINGDCQFGGRKCSLSHDISDEQPHFILNKYGLSETTFEELRRILSMELQDTEDSSSDEYLSSSDEHYTGRFQSKDNGKTGSDSHSSYDKICRKFGRSDRTNQTADTSDSDKESDVLSTEEEEMEEISENKRGLRCLPAWTSDSEFRHLPPGAEQQAGEVSNERAELMSPLITSSTNDGEIDSRMKRCLPSFDHRWQVCTVTGKEPMEMEASDHQELEFLYHTYLRARQCTVALNGKKMTINFEEMSGSVKTKEGEAKLAIQRFLADN